MTLSMGIVGLPNVGKSTLFNALTKKSVPAENYPFCTIDPSVGIVPVPDERIDKLAEFSHSEKKIPAVVEFVDIAGLVKGAAEGEGLGNQFLANIREVDAIAEVVRIYEDKNLTHVSGEVNPMDDISVINLELVLADLQSVTKRLGNVEKDAKRGDKDAIKEKEVLQKIEQPLAEGKFASSIELTDKEEEVIQHMHLLTKKPILYVLNKQAGGKNLDEMNDPRFTELKKFLDESGALWVMVDAKTEQELSEMSKEEKAAFKADLGMSDDAGIDALITKSYEMLGLISYFTTGPDETRGWTIKEGWSAPMAGTAIHTDFRDKFIRAEVIEWNKLLEAGSHAAAREKGFIRIEGKEYVVKDGDVIEFRI